MSLVLSDSFTYSGSPPVDPSKWFLGDPRPGNVGFSNAKFLLAGDTNIGLVFTGGGGSPLHINACYSSGGFTVPGGTSNWISGLISSAWDIGGSVAGVGVRRGYFEVVMTAPVDPLAGSGGSGTWPAFWLMQFETILGTGPTMEIDTELFGVANNQFPATSQWWPINTTAGPTNAHPAHVYQVTQVGGTSGFPTLSNFQGTSTTFGMLVDEFNVTWFVNGVQQCVMPLDVPESTDPFFLMIDLGMGGGWTIVPPTSPATSYPLIVTSANIWEAPMTTVTGVTSLSVSPTSTSAFSITYSAGAPAPTITPASSPTTSGSAVTIGTTSPGTGGDTLTVSLTTDTVFSSGSSLALTGGSAPYNISYTPGTITSNTTTNLTYTVHDTTNSTSTTETAQAVGLTVAGTAPVYDTTVHQFNAGSASSMVMPSISSTNTNLCLVLIMYINSSGAGAVTITGVTDTAGLTWTLRKRVASCGGSVTQSMEVWYAVHSSAVSSNVVTAALSGSATGAADLFIAHNVNQTTPFDANGSLPAFASSTSNTSVSVSTTSTNSLIFAGFRTWSTASPTAGSGFTLISGADYLGTERKSVTSAQSGLTVGLTMSPSNDASGIVADALVS